MWLKVTRQLKQNSAGKNGVLECKWNLLRSNIKGSKIKVDEVLTEQQWGRYDIKDIRVHLYRTVSYVQGCCRISGEEMNSPLDLALSSLPLLLVSVQVEQFKQDPSPTKCLHSVFNVDTGDEVHPYRDYHHLQVWHCAEQTNRLNRPYTINNIQSCSKSWDQWKTSRIKLSHC